jgi:uncharacterized protein YjbI with pentapeptide repeats
MSDRIAPGSRPATTSTVRGEDWYAKELSSESFGATTFVDVDLTEVMGRSVVFDECTFRSCTFNVSGFTDSAFVNCTFLNCSLFQASFTRCKLVGSVFRGCRFDLLRVDGGDWSFVSLAEADLHGVTLTGARMREADLAGASCVGASLTDLDLSGATWTKADLSGCDLRGTDLSSLDPLLTTVRGAIVSGEQAATIAAAVGFDVRP